MNDRKLTVLTRIAGLLALGEAGSAVIIGLGKDPWGAGFAVVFGLLFLLATWLLRSGRVTAGTVFTGILCLFEIVEFPSWHKHNALDWTYQSIFAVASLAGLIAAITVLAAGSLQRALARAGDAPGCAG